MEITDIQATSTPTPEPTTVAEESGLGQDEFLRIFLAQLQHQDPFNPQDSSELGAQLAQFSQLEQSLQMTRQLQGVNSRLDELISATGAQNGRILDPVAMIGRQVELEGNSLRLSETGDSEVLRIELEQESALLGLIATGPGGAFIGLSLPEDEGNSLTFPPGAYELTFIDGEPKLKTPGGQQLSLELTALRENEDGRLEVDPNGGPVSFQRGTVYPFIASAIDRSGQPFEPHTTTTGTVDSVRIVNGLPVLSIDGQDTDPSLIIRIR